MKADQREGIQAEILAAVGPDVERIFEGRFFVALSSGGLTPGAISEFAREYWLASNDFPRLLALGCAAMPSDELRAPFIRNLWDEDGRGVRDRSHRAMLQKFLDYLGVIPEPSPGGPAEWYFVEMTRLCEVQGTVGLLGAFGPGLEWFTPRQYRMLVEGLRRALQVPDGALEFFLDHIDHDGDHAAVFEAALSKAITSDEDVTEAVGGAKAAIAIECGFWDRLYDRCEQVEPAV